MAASDSDVFMTFSTCNERIWHRGIISHVPPHVFLRSSIDSIAVDTSDAFPPTRKARCDSAPMPSY